MEWLQLRYWVWKYWSLLLIMSIAISVMIVGGIRLTSDIDAITHGRIIRIEQSHDKAFRARAWIRLDDGQTISTTLPSRTNCFTGSRIEMARRSGPFGYKYQPTLKACEDPRHHKS